jgi:hypothetical protein
MLDSLAFLKNSPGALAGLGNQVPFPLHVKTAKLIFSIQIQTSKI